MTSAEDLDTLCINTIRTLCIDAVQKANSGHPGTPMAMAPVVYTLWQRFLSYNPEDPIWPNRDRFVLSAGHASTLLYSMLHLAGVKAVDTKYEILGRLAVTLEDLKRFRQLDSRCPGHPEYGWTTGVETTTGPLGQGFATSVGMAIAGDWLASRYNRPGFPVFNYRVYSLGGDGCMMEGVSSEAASLAGHLRLSNLCWIYDSNRITIEGSTDLAFSEDVAARFLGYGWNVLRVSDANDLERLSRAFETARRTSDRPTLIIVDSHIGHGAPTKHDSSAAHGEPLGVEEARAAKQFYGWRYEEEFFVPDSVRGHIHDNFGERALLEYTVYQSMLSDYRREYPDLCAEVDLMLERDLPEDWDHALPKFPRDDKGIASRDASAQVMNEIANRVPWLLSGSADLAPSTKTRLAFEDAGDFSASNRAGRNLHFGVREHAMAAILNGLALSKIRPIGSTFLIFSDYARPALRLSALMDVPVIYIFTHDSSGLGEDGPTHQPVEQLASLRAIPGLLTVRPADANEVVEAWRLIMQLQHEPVALILSRQALPTLNREIFASAAGLARGAYVLSDAADGEPQIILLASGSEVSLCVEAQANLLASGIRARVVSIPCWELFEQQSSEYRERVLPAAVTRRIAVEQASTLGWERYIGLSGRIIGMRTFGASAPIKALQEKFEFRPEHIIATALELLESVAQI